MKCYHVNGENRVYLSDFSLNSSPAAAAANLCIPFVLCCAPPRRRGPPSRARNMIATLLRLFIYVPIRVLMPRFMHSRKSNWMVGKILIAFQFMSNGLFKMECAVVAGVVIVRWESAVHACAWRPEPRSTSEQDEFDRWMNTDGWMTEFRWNIYAAFIFPHTYAPPATHMHPKAPHPSPAISRDACGSAVCVCALMCAGVCAPVLGWWRFSVGRSHVALAMWLSINVDYLWYDWEILEMNLFVADRSNDFSSRSRATRCFEWHHTRTWLCECQSREHMDSADVILRRTIDAWMLSKIFSEIPRKCSRRASTPSIIAIAPARTALATGNQREIGTFDSRTRVDLAGISPPCSANSFDEAERVQEFLRECLVRADALQWLFSHSRCRCVTWTSSRKKLERIPLGNK